MPEIELEEFERLIRRIQAGDEQAAKELVDAYEPEIRRDVRLRLTDIRLRRTLDSMDICQSVFGNFFVKVAMGQFNLDRPEQLLRLLSTMARNKVIDWHRHEKSRRPRNNGRVENIDGVSGNEPAVVDPSPSEVMQGRELLMLIEAKLSPEENELARLRREGQSWKEISELTGKSQDSIRKRLARACDRVFSELGLEQ